MADTKCLLCQFRRQDFAGRLRLSEGLEKGDKAGHKEIVKFWEGLEEVCMHHCGSKPDIVQCIVEDCKLAHVTIYDLDGTNRGLGTRDLASHSQS